MNLIDLKDAISKANFNAKAAVSAGPSDGVSTPTTPISSPPTTEASDKNKQDWNDFLGWLEKKGVRGSAALDKGNLGNKYFDEYVTTHKDTSLNKDVLPLIRNSYLSLRNQGIESIKAGKSSYQGQSGPETDTSNFMNHIIKNEKTQNPNYVGQHLTMTYFPSTTGKTYVNNKLVSAKQVPVATSKQFKNIY